jgi:GntR family transcriptional regulator, transcriptional repressor for pyruvate dehydrogenase complex
MIRPSLIKPIQKRQSLGADIAQQLQEMLVNGTYKPGDILPSQLALAEQFGTSLATVREAVSIIAAAGLIEAQAGRGTVVCATPDASGFNAWLGAVNQLSDANEFLETRRLLEHYTIARAAEHATPDQLANIRAILNQMALARDDVEGFVQADFALHFAIAEAGGNRVVTRILHFIHTPLATLLRTLSSALFEAQDFDRLHAAHERIVTALERRDASDAIAGFDQMLGIVASSEHLEHAMNGHVNGPGRDPLGTGFLEDLRWNLTRLVGPMAQVVIADAADELGLPLEGLQRHQLERFLRQLAGQLPEDKTEEFAALEDLFAKRYGSKTA